MVQKKLFKGLTTVLGLFCSFIIFAESLLVVAVSAECSICQVLFTWSLVLSRIFVKQIFLANAIVLLKLVRESSKFFFQIIARWK